MLHLLLIVTHVITVSLVTHVTLLPLFILLLMLPQLLMYFICEVQSNVSNMSESTNHSTVQFLSKVFPSNLAP